MTTMSVVGECFFWYRLTRVVPDNFHRAVKRLCVCNVKNVCKLVIQFPYKNTAKCPKYLTALVNRDNMLQGVWGISVYELIFAETTKDIATVYLIWFRFAHGKEDPVLKSYIYRTAKCQYMSNQQLKSYSQLLS